MTLWPRARFFHSTLFRLSFFYAAFFCVSVVLLLSFVYFATVRELENQIRHRISAETSEAQAVYGVGGVEALKKRIAEFIEDEDESLSITLLVDKQGKALAGNMESWPEDADYMNNWLLFDIESKHVDTGVRVLARALVFPSGDRLLIGYSLRAPDRMRHVILDVVTASILLALLITGLGGTLFSNIIKERLERVNQICGQVMHGDLLVKVPLTGGDDAFDHLAGNINAMLARIHTLVEGLKQTSDNIAHDLRTPLNRHRIRLEGIIHHPLTITQLREQVKEGVEEVDTIVETLNSILRISQAQSGVASSHFARFDLASVVSDVTEFYAELAEEKNIRMHVALPESLLVLADKPLLTQAIANLLDNAIKYTQNNGQVAVALAQDGAEVECRVSDNGPGIPSEYYQKVKERFFRLEASRTSPGTGLGLSLVEAAAVLHRGALYFADNQPGLSARLVLQVGVTEDALSANAPPAA